MTEVTMIQTLQDKYERQDPLTNEEVAWCLHHLADTRAAIRDDLCYSVLAQGILEGIFTHEQVRWVAQELYQTDALFHHISEQGEATLYRSFVALVWGVLLTVDGDPLSLYPNVLSDEECQYALTAAVRYLQSEKDYTGYDERYGWVHAMAHGADLLGSVLAHPSCPDEIGQQALETVTAIFESLDMPFIDEEENRLGLAILRGIHSGRVTQAALAQWIREQTFDLLDRTNRSYYQWTMYKHFLASIYFLVESEQRFEPELRDEMMAVLMDY